jgi:hypothetical protein
MSNIFSSRFWKALYFRAVGGQATDAGTPSGDISARLAGSGSLYGRMSPVGEMSAQISGSGSLSGRLSLVAEVSATMSASGSLVATLSITEAPPEQAPDLLDTHDGRKRQQVYDQDTLRALARAEDEADKARQAKERKSKLDLQRILGRALGEPEPPPPKPIAPPVAIVAAPEPQQPATSRNNPQQADALALRQKEDDDAIIILLLAA